MVQFFALQCISIISPTANHNLRVAVSSFAQAPPLYRTPYRRPRRGLINFNFIKLGVYMQRLVQAYQHNESHAIIYYPLRMHNKPLTADISKCRTMEHPDDCYRMMMGRRWSLLRLLLQIFGHILLVVNQSGSSPADKIIRIGYLLQRPTRAGAINVAIERAQKDGLLRDYNFRQYCSVMYNSCRTNLSGIDQQVRTCGCGTTVPRTICCQ